MMPLPGSGIISINIFLDGADEVSTIYFTNKKEAGDLVTGFLFILEPPAEKLQMRAVNVFAGGRDESLLT